MIARGSLQRTRGSAGTGEHLREPAVMDSYAWQSSFNFNPTYWTPRPIAVVLPGSTEEVVAIVKTCNKYGMKYKAMSRAGAHTPDRDRGRHPGRPATHGPILEIDEKNMYAVVEPCAMAGQIRAEAMKLGSQRPHDFGGSRHPRRSPALPRRWGCCWDGVVSGLEPAQGARR